MFGITPAGRLVYSSDDEIKWSNVINIDPEMDGNLKSGHVINDLAIFLTFSGKIFILCTSYDDSYKHFKAPPGKKFIKYPFDK